MQRPVLNVLLRSLWMAGIVTLPAWANPTTPTVVSGTVTFQSPDSSTLNITNTPGAVINWKSFSIGSGEITRFIQESASSAVLNRVVGGNISKIYGSLISNGQVYLINPSGILIGKGAIVDTAGLVASSLNMKNADFEAGRLKFQGRNSAGDVSNQGLIRTTSGGTVLLLAPDVENSGVIETPEGQILLAAGRKITITSLDVEGIQFELQSPANSVTNLGQLIADGGAVGVFAGTLKNSGVIQANALTRDEAGRVVLSASNKLEVTNGASITADGPVGGEVTLQSGKLTRVEGDVSATGSTGAGGEVRILGKQVTLAGDAQVDVSGQTAGGTVLVGGDYQGGNAAVPNAMTTYVGPDVSIFADALDNGDGGRVIVWSDQLTRFFGSLSARGGANGGNGGFAEISGKQNLVMDGAVDLGAPNGALGTLLLDPLDLFIDDRGGQLADLTDELADVPQNVVTVSPDTLEAINGNVILQASRDMYFLSDVNLATAGQGLTASAGTDLFVNASISTNGGALSLTAGNDIGYKNAGGTLATSGGAITLTATAGDISISNTDLNAGIGTVNLTAPLGINIGDVAGGAITVASSSGSVYVDNVTGSGALSISGSYINTDNLVSGGAATLTSATSIDTDAIFTNGGALNATAANGHFVAGSGTIDTRPGQTGATGGAVTITADDTYGYYGYGYVDTRGINAGNANVVLAGETIDTSGQAIDTTGSVTLTADNGDAYANASITAKINNAASVTAVANHQNSGTGYSATINISSDTVLNANTVTATTTDCWYYGSCGGANITLSGNLGVNVGTVTATAPVSFNNTYNYGAAYADPRYENINESVNISSSAGAILAMSGASQVTAADVTLSTIPSGNAATGGDIGSVGTALNVSAESDFVFKAGGDFNVTLLGDGPNRLDIQLGVAPASGTWSGTLTGTGYNAVALDASATDTTVTVNNFTLTGFDQRVHNQGPSIGLYTPNGNLDVDSASVPKGDNTGSYSPATRYTSGYYFPEDACVNGTSSCTYRSNALGTTTATVTPGYESLPVTLRASGDLIVDSYTRGGTAGDLAKSVTFQSNDGSVTLGIINGNRDAVTIQADTGVSLTDDLTTGGSVGITNLISGDIAIGNDAGDILTSNGSITISNSGSGTGNVSIWQIDTDGGSGNVTVTANGTTSVVGAAADNAGIEIDSAGTVTITAKTIGSNAFANPLDLEANIVNLTSTGGNIGSALNPVVARTESLIIDAFDWWNVDTDTVAIKNLTISASPDALYIDGPGPFGDVTSQGTTYTLSSSSGTLLELDDDFSIPASTHFVNGALAITAKDGSIEVNNGLDYSANFLTGGNITFYSYGDITFWEDIDIGAGTLVLRSDGAVNMYNLTAGSVNAANRSGSGCLLFGAYGCGVESFTADDMTLGASGALTVASRGDVTIDNINGGAISLTAHDGDISTGNIGAVTAAQSVNLRTGGYYFYYNGDGSIGTGSIDASGTVQITSYGTGILDGLSISTGNIGLVTAPSSVDIRANYGGTSGSPDAIDLGNVRTDDLYIASYDDFITTGSLAESGGSGTSQVYISGTGIETAAIDVDNIYLNAGGGHLTVDGEIGATHAAEAVELRGNGISAGDNSPLPAIYATGGTNSSGTVTIVDSHSTNDFRFETINAGAMGTVSITSSANGIEQTSSGGGITAKNVTLSAANTTNGNISQAINGDSDLDLFSVKNLTIVVGDSADLDVNGSTLESLSITTHADCPDCSQFSLVNLGGGQSLVVFDGGGGDFHVTLNSPSLLDFSFNATATGIQTSGSGIVTNGGNVTLNSADVFDGTAGGITTSGGDVTITADTTITTGAINSGGGEIDITAGAGIDVSGAVTTGSSGGPVSMRATTNNIDGLGTITSDTAVSLTADAGNVGSDPLNDGNAIDIDAPTATLVAKGTDNAGSVYAVLVGTSNLTLSAEEYFSVGSDTAYSTLSVTTGMGTGVGGAPVLTAPGQAFNWTRVFGDGELVVTSITGTGASTLTLNTLDGDLRVTGPIAATTLTLGAGYNHTGGFADLSGDSDLILDGSAGALTLTNVTQNFRSAGSIDVLDTVTATATTQNLTSREDINLLAGATAGESILFSATTQNFTAGELYSLASDINLTGDAGSVTLQGVSQTLYAYGDINLTGGSSTGAEILVDATGSQLLTAGNYYYGSGNIVMQAGTGEGADILVEHSGTGNQTLRADGNISMIAGGGASTTATILIDNQAGIQDLDANGAILLKGGAGANSTAKIFNTGTGNQLIGNNFGYYYDGRQYEADSITVEGGSGSGAFARVETAANGGSLQVFETGGLLKFQGGSGANATATAYTPGSQQIGWSYYYNVGQAIGGLSILGGTGVGAYASVTTPVAQQVWSYGDITLRGGNDLTSQGADAYAALTANTQSIYYGDVSLTGGTGSGTYALVQAATSQYFDSGDLDLAGGSGADAYAKVQAGTSQTFYIDDMSVMGGSATGTFARVLALGGSQYFSMDDLVMAGGSAAGADALIQASTSQTFYGGDFDLDGGFGTNTSARILAGSSQNFNIGDLALTGGDGSGSDATVEAVTSQVFDVDDIVLMGGSDASAVALLKGVGQTFDASNDITVESKTADARIQDTSAGVQAFEADDVLVKSNGTGVAEITTGGSQLFDLNDGFTILTLDSGDARVVSPSTQEVTADYIKVISNDTGNAALTATGDQTIITVNGLTATDDLSMEVAAMGTGSATVSSGGNQHIELDYPDLMYNASRDGRLKVGDEEAQGISTLFASGDQTIVARSITIEGGGPSETGDGDGASSEISADGAQVISTLLEDILSGGISVIGGDGDNASAALDPSSQSIVTNGSLFISGGGGSNSTGSVFSSGSQFIVATLGDINLTGGGGSGASASIVTSSTLMSLLTPGTINLIAGSGSDADAFLSAGNGFGFYSLFCGSGCSFNTLFGNPVGNGSADAGIFSTPVASIDVLEFLGLYDLILWYVTDPTDETPPERLQVCQ
jgi:filamentous hemagglutinin family protein